MNRSNEITKYAKAVASANNESARKELFINLLNALFKGRDDFGVIPKFAAGAEKSIANIDRAGKKSSRGKADTQYGTVIIEFENDLRKTGAHARDQLAEYLTGNWNSGIRSRFTLIATDCLNWVVYAPDYGSLIKLGTIKADEIRLEKVNEFRVEPDRGDEFYFFLDRYLFGTEPVPATLEEIRKRFGHGSDIFQAVIFHMHEAYESISDTPEMRVARTHWERFLRIAYGSFDAADSIFLIHSYLSVLAKMIAYEVISGDDYLDDDEIGQIITGEVFQRKNVVNFTDNDFYRWTAKNLPELKEAFRIVADGLGEMDFSSVNEDILKGVYQELVDDDTKHALGECYTPDWLCARIVEEMKPRPGQRILDPACGSGSFLKAAANYLIKKKPDITASALNECLYGIDIHPLSVQITKATLLIAYGKRLAAEKAPIRLNVHLANSLLLPTEEIGLSGDIYRISVDTRKVEIPSVIFRDSNAFSRLVETAEMLADEDYRAGSARDDASLKRIFGKRCPVGDPIPEKDRKLLSEALANGAVNLHKALLTAKMENRNGIWAYILANTYAPIALKGRFDLVIGNPPWLTFSDITARDYQDEVRKLAEKTGVCPSRRTLITHIELAALFVGQCAACFLKPGGKLAFIMPRSIFSADHHEQLRAGKIRNFAIDGLWDLREVSPLFKVPACALMGHRGRDSIRGREQVPGLSISGTLPDANSGTEIAAERLTSEKMDFYLSHLNERTAWSETPIRIQGRPPYKDQFIQGATLVPRSLCFVDIDQEIAGDLKDRVVRVKSANAIYREAKAPWNTVSVSGKIHSRFLFRTLLSNNIVPFSLTGKYLVALPIEIKDGNISLLDWERIELSGDLESARFFKEASELWNRKKTAKNREVSLGEYFNWQNKLRRQNLALPYSVVYNRSGSYAASAVIDARHFDLPFVIDSTAYHFQTGNEDEAFYLCAYLNSETPNRIIKPFQSRGLFGARDIHKKILEVPFPAYDPKNELHAGTVKLARKAASKASEFIDGLGFDERGNNLTPHETGALRAAVRKLVKEELDAIDQKIRDIITQPD